MNDHRFLKKAKDLNMTISTEEWVDENLFLFHEAKFSKAAKIELYNQIFQRCYCTVVDFEIITELGDEVKLLVKINGDYPILEVNKEIIFNKELTQNNELS